MPRSLKVAPEHVNTVKLALQRNGFPRQQDLAEELELSRDTVNRFLNGKAVDYLNFLEICRKLALDWKDVAGLSDRSDSESSDPGVNSPDSGGPVQDMPASESETIYNALLRLDYFPQVVRFKNFVETHPVGSCLVHGDEDHGQRWLVNRLVQLVPNSIAAKVIRFGLGRKSRANYINALWRELGGRVGLRGQPTPEKITEAVCKCWETQSVILIFHDVDQMPKEYMHEFIRDFWLPVAKIACNPPQPSRKLLMFLVDYTGAVEQWGVNFAETLECCQPQTPLKLPRIDRLGDRDLRSWMENSSNELPPRLISEIDSTVRDILENSDNGVPQLVLEYICSICDCNWYDEEQKWLKH